MVNLGLYILGNKGFIVLQELIKNSKTNISYVCIGKDDNVVNDYSSEIIELCISHNLKFFYRHEVFETENIDIKFAVGWRWLIKDVDKLIVLHDSILPKYRGFNPLVTALLNKDSEIGVTAIKANAEFDRGNILGRKTIRINYPIKINDAINVLSNQYSNLIIDIIEKYSSNKLVEEIQDEIQATYSLWREEEDYIIDWTMDAEYIQRFINSVGFPYNGAKTMYGERLIRIFDAEIMNDLTIENRTAGKILMINNGQPIVVCGKGLLKITNAKIDQSEEQVVFNKLRIKLK